jgi:hypothetical protein
MEQVRSVMGLLVAAVAEEGKGIALEHQLIVFARNAEKG